MTNTGCPGPEFASCVRVLVSQGVGKLHPYNKFILASWYCTTGRETVLISTKSSWLSLFGAGGTHYILADFLST